MEKNKIYIIIQMLALVGIGLAVYLIHEQFAVQPTGVCNINANVNCEAVISGSVAQTLGLPTPAYGLLGYILIFSFAMFRRNKWLLGVATFGLLFCLRIAYIELVLLQVICPVCVACQLIMIAVFILACMANKRKVSDDQN